jgi:hypothetical protein
MLLNAPLRVLALATVTLAIAPLIAQSQVTQRAVTSPSQAAAAQDYGRLPLAFEANQGQTDPGVSFLSRGSSYSLFLTQSEAVLALVGHEVCKDKPAVRITRSASCPSTQDIVRMKLAGPLANHTARAAGEDELPGTVNYFLGDDPTRWHTGLPTYSRVRLSRVYPGIDLVYYGTQGQLEYDFVVAPGAQTEAIHLSFKGEKHLAITANGDLDLEGQYGSATFNKPVVYQEVNGHRRPVAASFRLETDNSVSFAVAGYDRTLSLVIDPVLVYSTYLGGSGSTQGQGDVGNGIAVDAAGNAYVVGTTTSLDFPVSAHPFQRHNTAALDGNGKTVFVSKLNAAGTALFYSTYLGGTGGDSGYGIAVDPVGHAFVTGATYSTNFPVTCGAFQTINPSTAAGAPTAFVTELTPGGTELVYSTYLGGSGNPVDLDPLGDAAQAIVVQAGKAYVTGYTHSSDFPVTDNAFQTQFAGSGTIGNAFVTELNAAGTGLVYSTFLGGSGSNGTGDFGNALAIDGSGDIFVTGTTNSSNFPVTQGSLQTNYLGSATAFVTELNPDGSDQVYSTFLGGSGGDSAQAIAVDSAGSTYVGGITSSADFPLTAGVIEGTNVGIGQYYGPNGGGAFVAKLKQDGTALAYSTYFEGQATTVSGLVVDGAGNAYLTGNTPGLGAGSYGGFQSTPDALTLPTPRARPLFSSSSIPWAQSSSTRPCWEARQMTQPSALLSIPRATPT